jgi:two-component system, response regulator PdtaR
MTGTKSTVLVVEDDSLIRMSAVDLMTSAGFDVVAAVHADDAIQVLEARPDIRLVFTDVDMPGTMDGIKLCHYIRERWPPVKLIVASGKTILVESDLPQGARFFSKPYGDATIIDAISSLLAA